MTPYNYVELTFAILVGTCLGHYLFDRFVKKVKDTIYLDIAVVLILLKYIIATIRFFIYK